MYQIEYADTATEGVWDFGEGCDRVRDLDKHKHSI